MTSIVDVSKFGELKSSSKVRKAFRENVSSSKPRQAPHIGAFHQWQWIDKLENYGAFQHLLIKKDKTYNR